MTSTDRKTSGCEPHRNPQARVGEVQGNGAAKTSQPGSQHSHVHFLLHQLASGRLCTVRHRAAARQAADAALSLCLPLLG